MLILSTNFVKLCFFCRTNCTSSTLIRQLLSISQWSMAKSRKTARRFSGWIFQCLRACHKQRNGTVVDWLVDIALPILQKDCVTSLLFSYGCSFNFQLFSVDVLQKNISKRSSKQFTFTWEIIDDGNRLQGVLCRWSYICNHRISDSWLSVKSIATKMFCFDWLLHRKHWQREAMQNSVFSIFNTIFLILFWKWT